MIEHESCKLYNSMKHVPRGGVGYGRDCRSESRVDTKCDLCFHFGTETKKQKHPSQLAKNRPYRPHPPN